MVLNQSVSTNEQPTMRSQVFPELKIIKEFTLPQGIIYQKRSVSENELILTKEERRIRDFLPKNVLNMVRLARNPFKPVDLEKIELCAQQISERIDETERESTNVEEASESVASREVKIEIDDEPTTSSCRQVVSYDEYDFYDSIDDEVEVNFLIFPPAQTKSSLKKQGNEERIKKNVRWPEEVISAVFYIPSMNTPEHWVEKSRIQAVVEWSMWHNPTPPSPELLEEEDNYIDLEPDVLGFASCKERFEWAKERAKHFYDYRHARHQENFPENQSTYRKPLIFVEWNKIYDYSPQIEACEDFDEQRCFIIPENDDGELEPFEIEFDESIPSTSSRYEDLDESEEQPTSSILQESVENEHETDHSNYTSTNQEILEPIKKPMAQTSNKSENFENSAVPSDEYASIGVYEVDEMEEIEAQDPKKVIERFKKATSSSQNILDSVSEEPCTSFFVQPSTSKDFDDNSLPSTQIQEKIHTGGNDENMVEIGMTEHLPNSLIPQCDFISTNETPSKCSPLKKPKEAKKRKRKRTQSEPFDHPAKDFESEPMIKASRFDLEEEGGSAVLQMLLKEAEEMLKDFTSQKKLTVIHLDKIIQIQQQCVREGLSGNAQIKLLSKQAKRTTKKLMEAVKSRLMDLGFDNIDENSLRTWDEEISNFVQENFGKHVEEYSSSFLRLVEGYSYITKQKVLHEVARRMEHLPVDLKLAIKHLMEKIIPKKEQINPHLECMISNFLVNFLSERSLQLLYNCEYLKLRNLYPRCRALVEKHSRQRQRAKNYITNELGLERKMFDFFLRQVENLESPISTHPDSSESRKLKALLKEIKRLTNPRNLPGVLQVSNETIERIEVIDAEISEMSMNLSTKKTIRYQIRGYCWLKNINIFSMFTEEETNEIAKPMDQRDMKYVVPAWVKRP